MQAPSWSEMLRVYGRIGLLSFGGPAGQIALMHRELVEERRWIDEQAFLRALNFCNLLPGPEAQQLATYSGWKLGGWRAGLLAGALFVLPGAAVMLALSIFYVMAAGLDWFAALFLGVKAAVLAIVLQALIRIAGRALKGPLRGGIALASFAAFAVFAAPFPLVIAVAAIVGMVAARLRPEWLGLGAHPPAVDDGRPFGAVLRSSLGAVAAWGAIWAAPLLAVAVLLGPAGAFAEIGAFFSKLAVVTFGGAYAVLGYMAQEAVQNYHWLAPGEMADGLGLAETTPGPLIMVTQHVGFLAGYRDPGPFTPLAGGIIGALLTTWVTFAPCFLWIFAFAPWMERLERARSLQGGLAAITAAVVGVIAQLALWFALHVLFPGRAAGAGSIVLAEPAWSSFDWRAGALALLALGLIFALRRGILTTLALCALAGLALGAI